ncbi:MAG: bifunctional serine/threonine-protein kinase/formylglycine-generating enzyme family protein [Candidatus Solibacter sp.]|nr:bifunctional serine/threonine-protein kinase/formylglycine-generating enzyme family protein [Candidatus Solibacter sp.]
MDLPARIGKYELQEFLGGGMSHVYRAVDTLIGRTVAVKILTDAGCQDTEVKERFLAEARMAGSLTHDNVLGIYDFGEDDQQRPFMVMEFLRGEDLRHALRNGNTGDLRNKLKIAAQVARALGYVHTQKIIHRDLKPDNIHINTAGVVKLIDFGIAKTEGLQMTRAGYVLGTPFYMAPEQVLGENITEQVDVYAFGVLLFELLTGRKPVDAEAVERIFYSILNEPLKMEPLHEAGAPQSVCDLVARCTAKNPAARPQGFAPVSAELDRLIAEFDAPTMVLPTVPAPAAIVVEPPPPAASRPAWLVPGILVLIVALAAGIYFATRTGNRQAEPPPALAKTIAMKGGEMVLVEAGAFLAGEKKEPDSLPAFYIDKTEVSNAAYAQFCAETKHALPKGFAADKPDYPVVNVLILDARAFAEWAGKRLPKGRQWEKAARGTDGRLFPWGNQPEEARANVGSGKLLPVSALPNGASPCGALNMSGNVWELVDEVSPPGPQTFQRLTSQFKELKLAPPTREEPWYMVRGQSFDAGEKLEPGGLWDISTVPERLASINTGFRCVKDAK